LDITPERNSKIEKFFIAIFFSFAVATSAIANSAVLGLGLDSCAKVIENIEKEMILVQPLKQLILHILWVF